MSALTFRSEGAALPGAEDLRGGKKGGWGRPKAFGLYSRGSKEPPKIVSKLDVAKAMFERTSDGLEVTPIWGALSRLL